MGKLAGKAECHSQPNKQGGIGKPNPPVNQHPMCPFIDFHSTPQLLPETTSRERGFGGEAGSWGFPGSGREGKVQARAGGGEASPADLPLEKPRARLKSRSHRRPCSRPPQALPILEVRSPRLPALGDHSPPAAGAFPRRVPPAPRKKVIFGGWEACSPSTAGLFFSFSLCKDPLIFPSPLN